MKEKKNTVDCVQCSIFEKFIFVEEFHLLRIFIEKFPFSPVTRIPSQDNLTRANSRIF